MCIKDDGDLKEAEIYYRYNARSEKIKYPELKAMFDVVRAEERKSCIWNILKKYQKLVRPIQQSWILSLAK